MTASAPRAALQRGQIVAEARELISAAGLEALSLRRLASRLGVTAAALYAHVRDKRDLLRAVAELEFATLVDAFADTAGAAASEQIRAHARVYVDYARREPELFRVMFLFPPGLPDGQTRSEHELPAATEAFGLAAAAIENGVAAGELATDDPLLAALTFWAAIHGVATVLQLDLGLTPQFEDRLVTETIERLLAGYRAPATPAGE
jgi:AcrR family transcriptional regulator